jgi:hypothetical protein
MAQTKIKAGQFYGVSNNGTDGQFLKTDGAGGMSWDSPIANPTITSIDYPGSQTATDPAGGESVIINGTLFASGITCTVGGTSAVTAFNSATQITITTPAKAAGQYAVAVTNSNGGTASQANFIQYSGVPVWSTASGSLGNVLEGTSASFQVTATEGSDTIEYAVTTGSLPTGLSLNTNTGAITGTAPSVSADTTTTFSITATDDENQTSSERSFSITVQNDAPSNHFNTVLYNGNNSTQSITGVGFQPDLVWIKDRSATRNNCLFDTVRGPATNLNILYSDIANAQDTNVGSGFLSDTTSNGFNLGNSVYVNGSGNNYVAWCFKAGGTAVANTDGTIDSQVSVNNTLGFSIVKYTGNEQASQEIGHGLSSSPQIAFIKQLDGGRDWAVPLFTQTSGDYMYLNSSQAESTDTNLWSAVSSTTFTVGADPYTNGTGSPYIAYCFHSVSGFSKVGSYTGTGASGNLVVTGFEPAFVLIKETSNAGSWHIYDNERASSGVSNRAYLLADTSDAENQHGSFPISFLSNGFSVDNTANGTNRSNGTYIYLAIAADGSTTTPSLANSFDAEVYTGNNGTQSVNTGFQPDLVWIKSRTDSYDHNLLDSVRGDFILTTNKTVNQEDGYSGVAINSNGFTVDESVTGTTDQEVNKLNSNYVSWSWKAGGLASINTDGSITSLVSVNQAAGFSIVQWAGTRPSSNTIGHGLGLTPKMIIIKNLSITSDWTVYAESEGATKHGILDTTSIWVSNAGAFNNTSPTSSVFTVGADAYTNGAGNNIIAYCFADISGYSKVGTYTGNGTLGHSIAVGFAPDFVMLKMVTSTGDWYMFDSARTTGVYSDQLEANDSAAEVTGTYVDLTSTGFDLNTTLSSINNNGETFIYLAIKEN